MATIQQILTEAALREPRPLPEATELMDITVWPDGGKWYAETGNPPHNRPVPGAPFTSEADAVAHAITAIIDARQRLALVLELDLRRDLKQAPEPIVHVRRA
jgi:hypothetical protein